jgi:hypothetical protein
LGGAPAATGTALCVSHSPGGGKLATVHADGNVRVHDSSTFAVVEEWNLNLKSKNPNNRRGGGAVRSCAWAPFAIEMAAAAGARKKKKGDDDKRCDDDESVDGEDEDDDRNSASSDGSDGERSESDDGDSGDRTNNETTQTSTAAHEAEHLMLATGGDDGVVRVWRVAAHNGDDGTWFDAEVELYKLNSVNP